MKTLANDRFEVYYAEKIWQWIPAIYRHEDGLGDNPGVLRSLVEVIAQQAAILRRSQDRLWEDQFIETCDDWAVPYIGDLVGTRLLSAMLVRGRKTDVAKTIYYRRRKGTPAVLEELISDISQWDGKVVEGFQRLVRARHGLDPAPEHFAGRFTGTPPGGFADLRSATGSELADGPFEEYFHLPDIRPPRGLGGRYGIPKLLFYLFRLKSFPVTDADPFSLGDDSRFLFDPSGRNIPLFSKRSRPSEDSWDTWHSAFEWELPLPVRCRLLADASYIITDQAISALTPLISAAGIAELKTLIGISFTNEDRIQTFMSTMTNAAEFLLPATFKAILKSAIIDQCGKNQLIPASILVENGNPLVAIEKEDIVALALPGNAWIHPANSKLLGIDAEQGRFKFLNAAAPSPTISASYHYGFSGPTGAGTYDRRNVEDSEPTAIVLPLLRTIGAGEMLPTGVVEIMDNKTYAVQSDHTDIVDYTLQAANQRRPYLLLNADWILSSGINEDARLVLDGLWIGAPGGTTCNIIIRGDFESVIIRNCTFDPGGDTNGLGQPLMPVSLHIEGTVEKLCIESCILARVVCETPGLIGDEACISDSIVQFIGAGAAINITMGVLTVHRSTIFGKLTVHRLFASEILTTAVAYVTDTQNGCFRFSAAPEDSRLPRPYQSFPFKQDSEHWFGSKKFGQPAYAQVSETAPFEISRGSENGGEMGAFNGLLNPLKLDGLKSKIEEYMPFGLIPAFINKT